MRSVDLAQHRARVARAAAALRVHPLVVGTPLRRRLGGAAAAQVRAARRTPPTRSPAGTSRRSCSPSGSGGEPTLLIVDEPTRGIDIATKAEVHRLLDELAGQGVADPDDLLRAPRGAARRRPDPRHARGPARRGARARRGQRGDGSWRRRPDRSTRRRPDVHRRSRSSIRSPVGRDPLRPPDRPRLPAARLRDRRRARAADHRHLRGPAALPERPGGQHRPRQHVDPGAAHARRGDGDHLAQRRSVDRLGARPLRLRLGEHVRPSPRRPDERRDRRRVPRRDRRRGGLRNRERRADDYRPRAEPRGDAGDALHHPRDRHPDHRRRSGRRQLAARTRSSRSRSGTSTTSRTSRSRSPS